MIEATQRKLREAQFFYRCLAESEKPLGPDGNEPEAFSFYLSAFISAARSVSWVLQNEEREKYDAWLPTWEEQLSPDERQSLRFMNERRLDTVKRSGIEATIEWEDIDIYELLKTSRLSSKIFDVNMPHAAYGNHASASGPERPSVSFVRPVFHFEREGVKEEVTATCRKYLDYLERLVRDFSQAHGGQTEKRPGGT
jgi:hypothetical protein